MPQQKAWSTDDGRIGIVPSEPVIPKTPYVVELIVYDTNQGVSIRQPMRLKELDGLIKDLQEIADQNRPF